MNKTEREAIRTDFLKMISKSWTYEKLNRFERAKIDDHLLFCKLYGSTKNNIYEVLHSIYFAFLLALNYKPIGWREDINADDPKF